MKIYLYQEVESTQKIAKKIIDDGIGENSVILADSQTAGRGRLERTWISPKGGLYCSIILKINKMLPVITGVVIADVLQKMGVQALLKWPNDIIVQEKKIAGILIEAYKEYAIVGIGMNLEFSPLGNSISLWDLGIKAPRDQLLNNLLDEFKKILALPNEQVLARYRDYSLTLGRLVKVELHDTMVEGYALDIDKDGSLLIKSKDRVIKVMTGDCIHLQ